MDSDSDDSEPFQRQALPVAEGVVGDGPPATAEEYLAQVMREAKSFPSVMVAAPGSAACRARARERAQPPSNKPGYLAQFGGPIATPPALEPSQAWVARVVDTFAAARMAQEAMARHMSAQPPALPEASNTAAWCKLCFHSNTQPTTAALGELDQVTTTGVLTLLVDALCSGEEQFGHGVAGWLYCLLCCLDHVMGADMQATLRALMRHCALLRSKMIKPSDEFAAETSLLIAIVSVAFKQGTV